MHGQCLRGARLQDAVHALGEEAHARRALADDRQRVLGLLAAFEHEAARRVQARRAARRRAPAVGRVLADEQLHGLLELGGVPVDGHGEVLREHIAQAPLHCAAHFRATSPRATGAQTATARQESRAQVCRRAHVEDGGFGVVAALRLQVAGRLALEGVVARVAAARRAEDALERVHELLLEGARRAPRLQERAAPRLKPFAAAAAPGRPLLQRRGHIRLDGVAEALRQLLLHLQCRAEP